MARRFGQLLAGLILYGLSMSLMVRANLGLDPWDTLHQGLARHTGIAFGTMTIIVGAMVLLLWIPLRQRPGIGTVCNVVVIGLVVDGALAWLPAVGPLGARALFLVAGVGLNGVATAVYIGAGLGPGPRDGLMTGLAARGWSVRVVRSGIEATVLLTGWLLGGTVGVGTVAYAVSIGPLVHELIPFFTVPVHRAGLDV
ncbi:MAG: YczE/YyaS/YitT family protein [Frankia sp.]